MSGPDLLNVRLKRPLTLGLVGLGSTALYAALAFLGADAFGLPPAPVSLIAYMIAGFASYLAHRHFTFAVSGEHGAAPARFALLSLAGYAIAFLAPLVLSHGLGYPPLMPILITCVAVPVINALALSRLVFGKPLFDHPRSRTEP